MKVENRIRNPPPENPTANRTLTLIHYGDSDFEDDGNAVPRLVKQADDFTHENATHASPGSPREMYWSPLQSDGSVNSDDISFSVSAEPKTRNMEKQIANHEGDSSSTRTQYVQVFDTDVLRYEHSKQFYDKGLKLYLEYHQQAKPKLDATAVNSRRGVKRNALSTVCSQSEQNKSSRHSSPNSLFNMSSRHGGRVTDRDGSVAMQRRRNETMESVNMEIPGSSTSEEVEFADSDDDFEGVEGPNETVIRNRQKLQGYMKKIVTQTGDPAGDYVTYLKEVEKMIEIIVSKYETFQETTKLDKVNVAEHWSMERMTREKQEKRFTRWDAAMTKAILEQTRDEIKLFETNSYVFRKLTRKEHCKVRAMKMERIINEPLEKYTSIFCYQQFSLLDIAERKTSSNDELIFTQAIVSFKRKKHLLSKNEGKIRVALRNQGIHWEHVKNELKLMTEKNYLLPKGKLFCRLVLNVAELFYYSVYKNNWSFRMQGGWEENNLFKGVQFNQDGNEFQF